jgi:hypothetical protein
VAAAVASAPAAAVVAAAVVVAGKRPGIRSRKARLGGPFSLGSVLLHEEAGRFLVKGTDPSDSPLR